jgi:biotin synthase
MRAGKDEILHYITTEDSTEIEKLFERARAAREHFYGRDVYFRGLIEFSSYCKNNCLYCGLRNANTNLARYRLTKEQILDCCRLGAELGYKTYVLQSGEDEYFTDDSICDIVSAIRSEFPDTAITLSIGEKSREAYRAYFDAGADRYLLRHETANEAHYAKIHPKSMSARNRKNCLLALKEIGYEVGAGFMVGAPFQTAEDLAEDIAFLRELQPDMIGIGPFIPQSDTPFAACPAGTLELTLRMLALVRLAVPNALLPATTALGTISPDGREQGLNAGANVVMPNLSPGNVRKLYALYDNKICTGDEAAECRFCIERRIVNAGFTPVFCRGDKSAVAVEAGAAWA